MKTFLSWLLTKITPLAFLGVFTLFYIFNMISEQKLTVEDVTAWAFIVVPIDIVLSVCATVFTYRNFDEVFSRSKRWRNSNVEKFDMRIWYCLALFFKCLFAIPFIIFLIVIIYYIINNISL